MRETVRLRMRIFAVACFLTFLAASVTAGVEPLLERVELGVVSPESALAELATADEKTRLAVYRAMAKWPERWARVLLDRLDDRIPLSAAALRTALAAGAVDAKVATARLEKHHASPHAFVRLRAGEAMAGIDRERGIRWLEEELRIRRTWNRMSYRNCDGTKGGLEGRIERLKNPPVDPYETVGETVVVSSARWRIEVVPLPFRGKRTFRVLLRNAGEEAFLRLPNLTFGVTMHWERALGRAEGIGGGSVGGSHPELVRRIEPGEVAFDTIVDISREHIVALDRVVLDFSFTMPGRRAGRTTVTVPAAHLTPTSDLATYRAGMSHLDRAVRFEFLGMLTSGRIAVPEEARRGVVEILLPALEAVPPREDPEPIFFWSTRTGTPGVDPLVESLARVHEGLVRADFDRLLRLRNSCAVRRVRRLPWDPRLGAAARTALDSEDPVIVRNLALLHAYAKVPTDADLLPAVERWLRSTDTIILRAGLHVLSRTKLEPEGWKDALSHALASEDPRVVRAAVFTASRRAEGIDRRLLEVGRATEHEEVRVAVLEALRSKGLGRIDDDDARALGEFLAPMLIDLPDSREEQRLLRSLVARDVRLIDLPRLIEANERSGNGAFFDLLCRRGYDFGRPVLAGVRRSPDFERLRRAEPRVYERLARIELDRPDDAEPEAHYTALLTEAIHAGNDLRAAAACLALSKGKGAASLRALETATGSNSDEVALCAAWCLALGDPERARPEIEGSGEEDPEEEE